MKGDDFEMLRQIEEMSTDDTNSATAVGSDDLLGLSVTTHDLKTWPAYFERVANGEKTFEIRQDDRGYQRGDHLLLREYDPDHHSIAQYCYTGRAVTALVTYITAFEQKEGYVVMAIRLLSDA